MRKLLLAAVLLAGLIVLSCPAFSQTIVVNSPTASQMLSGVSYTFTASLSSLPSTCYVQWFVNGELQGTVWNRPWSLAWNTADIYNSAYAKVDVEAFDCANTLLATSPAVPFVDYNTSGSSFPPQQYNSAYLACGAITTSTPLTSPWSGNVTVTMPFTGTAAATNQLDIYAAFDGDYRVQINQDHIGTWTATFPTTMVPNGPHQVQMFPHDVGPSGGSEPYPFCGWEQTVNIQNGTTPMELLVSPKEAVIAPGATLQLAPIIDNTDLTTSTASSPSYSSTNTAICTVSSSGLITAAPNPAFGTCSITVTSGSLSRTINEYVQSTNYISHFGSDGQLHNAWVQGVSMWFASSYNQASNCCLQDPAVPASYFANQYLQAGFNTYEDAIISGNPAWGTSESNFHSLVASYVATEQAKLSPWVGTNTPNGLYLHGITTSQMVGNATGTNISNLYGMIVSPGGTYSTPAWTYLTQYWMNPSTWTTPQTGNTLVGISGPDESSADYHYPLGQGVLGSTNGPTQITCVTSAPTAWVIAWPGPPGPDWMTGSLTHDFIITGATTNSQLNNLPIGTGTLYHGTVANSYIASATLSFTGPSCASGNVTATPTTDPGLIVQWLAAGWDNNATSYVPWNAFQTFINDLHAASPAAPYTGPPPSNADPVEKQQWLCNFSDFSDFYVSFNAPFNAHPGYASVQQLYTQMGPAIRSQNTNCGQTRVNIYGNSPGTPTDYGFQGQTQSITSIAGPLVTFSAPHGISTVYPLVSRMTISGSSNAYFNGIPYAVTAAAWSSGTATYTIGSEPFSVNQLVTVIGASPSGWNITQAQITAVTSTTFSVAIASNPGTWTSGGSATTGGNVFIDACPTAATCDVSLATNNAPSNLGPLEYKSGLTCTGPTGSYVNVGSFPGWTGGSAILTLTNINTIAANTGLVFTGAPPTGGSTYPTTATVTAGTASCSGTITIAPPSTTNWNGTPNYGYLTFADGTTTSTSYGNNIAMVTVPGGASASFICGAVSTVFCDGLLSFVTSHWNETFTFTDPTSQAPSYYSQTFRLTSCPMPVSPAGNGAGTSSYTGVCTGQYFSSEWREVPPSSETSGTASSSVTANNNLVRGVNYTLYGSLQGPRFPFAAVIYSAVLGYAGHRAYNIGANETLNAALNGNLRIFNAVTNQGTQVGMSPLYDNGEAQTIETFWAFANANNLLQRLVKTGYLYQPRYGAPDIGFNIESSLRKGFKGNLLMAVNLQDGYQTRTVDLTGCEVSGQPIIRYMADYAQISMMILSAGTTSDKAPFTPGGSAFYLCSNDEAAELAVPMIAPRLADIPNANDVVVQYSYSPYAFAGSKLSPPPLAVDCGMGTCAIPVDRNIGPVYFRLEYRGTGGTVLATSDVQTL